MPSTLSVIIRFSTSPKSSISRPSASSGTARTLAGWSDPIEVGTQVVGVGEDRHAARDGVADLPGGSRIHAGTAKRADIGDDRLASID